jgi:hypothetical protein
VRMVGRGDRGTDTGDRWGYVCTYSYGHRNQKSVNRMRSKKPLSLRQLLWISISFDSKKNSKSLLVRNS